MPERLLDIAAGALLMMALFNLAFYFFRMKEKASLYFSMFCLGNAVRFLLWANTDGNYLYPILESPVLLVIRQLFLCVAFIGLIAFVLETFGRGNIKKLKYTLFVLSGFTLLSLLEVSPITSVMMLLTAFIIQTSLIVVTARSPMMREGFFPKLYLVGLCLFVLSFLMNNLFLAGNPYMAIPTNCLFALIHVIFLTHRYAKTMGMVESARDDLEEKVAEQTQELRTANTSMKELITAMSHDLKTPLTIMGHQLEILTTLVEDKDDTLRSPVSVAYNKSLDLQRLTQNLLEASRLETGAVYEISDIRVSRLMAEMQQRYGELVESSGLTFDVAMEADAAICIDHNRIYSVFDNILYNAIRHTKDGGITIIGIDAQDETFTITIKDTGPGVESKHLPHLLDRFYKASSGRGGTSGDSGLGLYIVSQAMRDMGGSVKIESEEGVGFSVILAFRKIHQK